MSETNPAKAELLATKLHDLRVRNPDGVWYGGYDYESGEPIVSTEPVGAIAWTVFALQRHYLLGGSITAHQDDLLGASWLASLQQPDGSLPALSGEATAPTEPNLDAWWAFRSVGYWEEADS